MKPEQPRLDEFLDPAHFPDELAWVPAHYRMHPADPVYLLVAWHWRRVKKSEDTLAAGILELRTLLDARTRTLADSAETVSGINDALAGVQAVLEERPGQMAEQMDTMLAKPIASAVEKLQALEAALNPVARSFETSQRRQLLAALLVGVAVGVLSAAIILLA